MTKKKVASPTSSVELIDAPKRRASVSAADDTPKAAEEEAIQIAHQDVGVDIESNGLAPSNDHDATGGETSTVADAEASTSKGSRKARLSFVEVVIPGPHVTETASPAPTAEARTRKVRVDSVPTKFGELKELEPLAISADASSTSQTPLVPDTQVEVEVEQTPVEFDETPIDTYAAEPEPQPQPEPIAEQDTLGKGKTAVTRSKNDKHGPVPVPTAEQLKAMLPPAQASTAESSQSTSSLGPSQLDPIQQYSSPLRGPLGKDKGKTRQSTGEMPDSSTASAKKPERSKGPPAPVVVTRYINGEEVLAVESDDTGESEQESPPVILDDAMEVDTLLAPVGPVEVSPRATSLRQCLLILLQPEIAPHPDPQSDEPIVVEETAIEAETALTPAQVVMQSEYDIKIAEIAALQQQLVDRQKLVDDLEEKVKLAEAQAQASVAQSVSVEQTVIDQIITSNVPVVPAVVSKSVDTAPLPASDAPPAAAPTTQPTTQPIIPDANPSTSAVPTNGETTAAPASAPELSSEEVAQLIAGKEARAKRERMRANRAERRADEMEETLQFMRNQYEEASTSAVREVNKANELEEKVERLQGQLKFGLKQRDMSSAEMVKQHKTEIARMTAQVNLLLDQNRMTDDNVRMRAAAYHELKANNARLEAELKKALAKNRDLSERNDDLLGQVELFRAREMGVIPVVDDSDDDDYEYASDGNSSNVSASPPPLKIRIQRPVPNIEDTASQLLPNTQDLATLPVSALRETLIPNEIITHDVEIRQQVTESPWTPGLYFQDEAVSPPGA